MKFLLKVIAFFKRFKNILVTQEFKLEEYSYVISVPFTKRFDIWRKVLRPIIRFRGKEWERNRDEFMIKRHGMTNAEILKPENKYLFIAKLSFAKE